MNRFPNIGSYGFISDCHTAALVSYTGNVEWLCLPRFDSPTVFGSILDRSAGSFRLAPTGVVSPLSRRYEPGTLIVETTWFTETGWAVATDALTIPAESEARSRTDGHKGTPRTGHEADHCLIRHVTCIDGEVEIEMICEPRPAYGLDAVKWTGGNLGEAEAILSPPDRLGEPGFGAAPEHLHLTSDLDLELDGGTVSSRLAMKAGDSSFCALSWDESDLGAPRSAPEAEERLASTREFWRLWLRHGSFPDHPWRIHLQRSALVLKGLTYAPTGAIVAAPTTSLPETPGGERNWDYRYSWIRDSTFTLWAMHTLGFSEEAADFMRFIGELCRNDPQLQIMYGVGGEKDLTESTLDHLSGYEDSRPVRIGNGAYSQRQNDVWGALLDSVYLHSKALGDLSDENWEMLEAQVEAAIEAWPHPDQGIWEARGEPKHYVSSKLMIWVALDRGRRLAEARAGSVVEEAEECRTLALRWGRIADEIKDEICEHGVRDGVFRQHYDTDALDASTLLIPLFRFLPPDDPRVRDTVVTVARELNVNGMVLRYITQETDDGLHGEEGTFMICSFWLVSALSEIGEQAWARALCERLLTASGWLDLYAEEFDVTSGRHLGNFPQAFTHLALINAVSHVIADEQRRNDGVTAVFSEMRGATIAGG